MTTTEDLLYEAAKAIARAKNRIEELEAQVCVLRAEIQRLQQCSSI